MSNEVCNYYQCDKPIWKDHLCQEHYHYVRIQRLIGFRLAINKTDYVPRFRD